MQNTLNRLDNVIARILFVRPQKEVYTEERPAQAENAFSFALVFSGVRCIIMYVIFPFVLPIIGLAGDFAGWLDVGINFVAIGAIIFSLRRFWTINYNRKWQYFPVAMVALVLLTAFIALDLSTLL